MSNLGEDRFPQLALLLLVFTSEDTTCSLMSMTSAQAMVVSTRPLVGIRREALRTPNSKFDSMPRVKLACNAKQIGENFGWW